MDVKKKLIDNESGQAFFEMIMFVPFMLFLFTLIVTFGSSINGAINQNKILRGFFWHGTRNNSYGHKADTLDLLRNSGLTNVGIHHLGYRDTVEGPTSNSVCYKLSRFFGGPPEEECNAPSRGAQESSFIRIYTFYGVCGANWSVDPRTNAWENQDYMTNTLDGCTNR